MDKRLIKRQHLVFILVTIILFLTSMADVSLYHQNKMSLAHVDYKGDTSKVKVAKITYAG